MPLVLPPGTNLLLRTWVTNTHAKENRLIICPKCHGTITFNAEELTARRAAGQNTSTPCRPWVDQGREWVQRAEDYHPGWPPEPWYVIPADGILEVGEPKFQMGPDVQYTGMVEAK